MSQGENGHNKPNGSQGLPLGLMQDWPLTVDKVLEHANRFHGNAEVVTRSIAGPIVRKTYSDIYRNSRKVSEALLDRGLKPGDVVASLAWNTDMHMETWFGAMGIGMPLHTLNPRLHPKQLAWMMNHAEDQALFVDLTFLPLIEAIADHLPMIKLFVLLGDKSMMPKETRIPGLISYEELLEGMNGSGVSWGGFDENTACGICYTSGTTGNPKGVVYSHRSNVLHTLMSMQADALGVKNTDTLLPIVPMFHANAWGLTFSCPAAGAKMVMPGARMDGEAIYELLDSEKVTASAAVPTVWQMLLQYLTETGKELPYLKRVAIGGSATPAEMMRIFENKYDVEVSPCWGMTETSPLGSVSSLPDAKKDLPYDEQMEYKLKAGRPPFGVELCVKGPDGTVLPHDGKSNGHLMVRGPAVSKAYLKHDENILDENGYFDTGDVANIDEFGLMQITDRSKDVIKSGGEWISSIELENHTMGHPAVALAGAIGIAHPKWDERPLLIVQLKPGASATKEEILANLEGKIAKWWMPDAVEFVDEVPLGNTGKINKLELREMYKDYKLPTA